MSELTVEQVRELVQGVDAALEQHGQFGLGTLRAINTLTEGTGGVYLLAHAYLAQAAELEAARGRERGLREALEWYGEQARLCRLIHSEGDAGRYALSNDGGKRARAALTGADS